MCQSEAILDTSFTVDFVVSKCLPTDEGDDRCTNDLVGYDVEDITGGSAFFGRILKVKFNWRIANGYARSVVLKIPQTTRRKEIRAASAKCSPEEFDRQTRKDEEYLQFAHLKELCVYRNFSKPNSSLLLPYFYYGHQYSPLHRRGVIIMEDLTTTGVVVPPITPGFTNEQVEALVRQLARIHVAASEKFSQIYSELPKFGDSEEYVEMMQKMTQQLLVIRPGMFAEIFPRILPLFDKRYLEDNYYTTKRYGMEPVLVHGDLWSSNVLWQRDYRGEATRSICAIIDWQATHLGNPCEDFLRFLALNVPASYRRENMDRLLELYRSEIAELRPHDVPTTEMLNDALTAGVPYTVMYLGFGASMYFHMPSVCPTPEAQDELLDRVRRFFEDAADRLCI